MVVILVDRDVDGAGWRALWWWALGEALQGGSDDESWDQAGGFHDFGSLFRWDDGRAIVWI